MSTDAIDIYQTHLDVSTRLVVAGDATGYGHHVQLPFVFCTARGVEVVETAADVADDVRSVRDAIAALGTTDYHRIARSARFLDDTTIEGFHVTHALRGAIPVFEPYDSRMILRRVAGVWKTCYAEHELADPVLSGRNPQALHGYFAKRWSGARRHAPDNPEDALAIYGETLTRIAARAEAGDEGGLNAHYTWPFWVHHDTGDTLVTSPEQAGGYLAALHRAMAEVGADRLAVRPVMALYLSDTRLLGYHEVSLTRNGACLSGPVQSRMILVLRDGAWLCTSVTNALSTRAFNEGTFVPSDSLPTLRQIAKRTR